MAVTHLCKCGAVMIVKHNRNNGHPFLGCSRFPDCWHTKELNRKKLSYTTELRLEVALKTTELKKTRVMKPPITSNFPIPSECEEYSQRRFPFNSMKVGDSFFVPTKDASDQSMRAAIVTIARRSRQRYSYTLPIQVISRIQYDKDLGKGLRVWCVGRPPVTCKEEVSITDNTLCIELYTPGMTT